MSHYAAIALKMNGDAEAIVRALCDMERANGGCFTRDMIEVHKSRQNLIGFQGDTRDQKAHIIIRRKYVGRASNDIGFEQKADGSWIGHISDFDKSTYNPDWQKRLLSKWAVQKVGCEAEKHGYKWNVEYQNQDGKQFAYVNVIR